MNHIIRSIIFYIVFFAVMILLLPAFLFSTFILRDFHGTKLIGRCWLSWTMSFIRKVLGITHTIENIELIKRSPIPLIIASKHQSMWETFLFVHELSENTVLVSKKELLIYPGLKTLAKAFNIIVIDRKDAMEAIKQLVKEGKELHGKGFNILIFPEGTRVTPGAPTEYKRGLYFLYKALNTPVVTVAHDAGVFWPAKTFIKKSGHITVKVTGMIDPGVEREAFQDKLIEYIENPSLELWQRQRGSSMN